MVNYLFLRRNERMNLRDMLKEGHRYDENVVIAEFKNGVNIIYENNPEGIIYAPIPPRNVKSIELEDIKGIDGEAKDRDLIFHSWTNFYDAYRNFWEKSYENKLEHKIQDQFGKVVEELEIATYTGRDWKGIGCGLSAGLLAPLGLVTIPVALIMSAVSKERLPVGVGALAAAPVIAPIGAISELIKPSTQYARVGKENAIVAQNINSLPAVYFCDISGWKSLRPQKFNHMQVCFSSGDEGSVYPKYLGKSGFGWLASSIRSDERRREEIKNNYQRATQFLNIGLDVNNEMNSLLEERAAFPKVWKEFTAQLHKENQEALLKSIGFM